MLIEEDHINIDLYLSKKLEGQKKIAFEAELRGRPELMEEVRFQFKLLKGMQEIEKKREREVLRVFLAKVKNENHLVLKERTLRGRIVFLWRQNASKLAIAASFIGILGAIYFLTKNPNIPKPSGSLGSNEERTPSQIETTPINVDSIRLNQLPIEGGNNEQIPPIPSTTHRQTPSDIRPSNRLNETIQEITITYIDRSIDSNYGVAPESNSTRKVRNFTLKIEESNKEFNRRVVVGTFTMSNRYNEITLLLNEDGRQILGTNSITSIEKTDPYKGNILSDSTVILRLNFHEQTVLRNN